MVQKGVRMEGKEIEREKEPRMERVRVGGRLTACEGDRVEIKISIRVCGWKHYGILGSCQC